MKLISRLVSIFSARSTVPIPSTSENEPSVNQSFVVQMLVSVLRSQGYDPADDNGGVSLPSGIRLEVELLEVVELNPQGFRTSSMIRAVHGTCFPSGLAEYQHTVGKSFDHALSEGFSVWAKMDLVTLEDAVREKPENCTVIEMDLPGDSTQAGLVRQIILGPVGHFVSQSTSSNEKHPFCPCCLLTKNFEAFRPLIAREDVLGIRFSCPETKTAKWPTVGLMVIPLSLEWLNLLSTRKLGLTEDWNIASNMWLCVRSIRQQQSEVRA